MEKYIIWRKLKELFIKYLKNKWEEDWNQLKFNWLYYMKQKAKLDSTKMMIYFIEEFGILEDALRIYGTDIPLRTTLEMKLEKLLIDTFTQVPKLKDIPGVKDIENIEKVLKKIKSKQKTK